MNYDFRHTSTRYRHGRSAGIGYELAKYCAEQGFDWLVADQPAMHDAAQNFRARVATVEAIEADLATQGIDRQQRIPKPKGRQRMRLRPVYHDPLLRHA